MRNLITALILAVALPVGGSFTLGTATAQTPVKSERVAFRPGATSTVISRTIRGHETIDFLVNARAGQRVVVSMTSSNASAYFNIIPPGERDVASYVGANSQPANSYDATLPASGDTKIRVYLFRAAAMRGERADIRLSLSITGSGGTASQLPGAGGSATQLPGDALVPGTQYHATGNLSCMASPNSRVTDCRYGVVRLGGGSAAIVITKSDGRMRTLIFRQGTPVGFDQGARDPNRLTWKREGYQSTVQIGGERYYVPDAIVFGG